jgi:hypothetical protein
LCVLSAAPINGQVKPAPPDSIVTLMVPATAPWTDTGITLSAGDAVEIRTWGRVIFDNTTGLTATPRGSSQRGGGCTFVVTDGKVPPHGVVGNVAPAISLDGQGFFVGTAWKGLVPVPGSSAPQGRLFLGFNGSNVLCDRSGYDSWAFGVNHAGWFTAEVSITRSRPPSRPD